MPEIEEFTLRMKDAERKTGISVRTLYERIATGELASTTIGKRRLIFADSLKALLAKNANKPPSRSWFPKHNPGLAPEPSAVPWEGKGRGRR